MTKNTKTGEPEAELITIHSFDNQIEAEFAKTKLESAGIQCFLSGDDCGGMRPALTFVNGIKLIVRADDATRATEILSEEGLKSR
jgi:Putative prokaryotic signal transducing protein